MVTLLIALYLFQIIFIFMLLMLDINYSDIDEEDRIYFESKKKLTVATIPYIWILFSLFILVEYFIKFYNHVKSLK